ncbi:MAG: ferritin [Candidatus Omnitrophica bacterium]|nr:ferritin [Candidatus Omnitrophota bacterium]
MEKQLYKELNKQVIKELYSAYLYMSMASFFDSINLKGFAHWMKVQAEEESQHAMKIYDYINERGERVIFELIEKPPYEFTSPLDIFEKTLEHEKKVTKSIEGLVNLAKEKNDKNAEDFLQWFVKEQEEEEENALSVLEKLKSIGNEKHMLIEMDIEMGKRE